MKRILLMQFAVAVSIVVLLVLLAMLLDGQRRRSRRLRGRARPSPIDFARLRATIDAEARLVRVPRGAGRGIVMCAGGKSYLAEAFASLRTVRRAGCDLPVEIFYVGREEMPSADLAALFVAGVGNVTFRDATSPGIDMGPVKPTKLRGWEIKSYALLLTSFDEILFLDADCGVLVDPTFLFSDPAFERYGNVFWPDYWFRENLILQELRVDFGSKRYPPGFETESGEILIRKNACRNALVHAWLLNKHQDVTYRMYHGDKDLFRVGFNMAGTPFYQIERMPGILGFVHPETGDLVLDTMVQHAPGDDGGRPVFVHRTMKKRSRKGQKKTWTVFVPNDGMHRVPRSAAASKRGGLTCADHAIHQLRRPSRAMVDVGNAIDDDEVFALST